MSRKYAGLMLVVVALWAAAPAFACFMPTAHHACCRHMMQACAAMQAAPLCCQVRQSSTTVPPARAARTDSPVQVAQISSALHILIPALISHGSHRTSGTPPPLAPPGVSVLRI